MDLDQVVAVAVLVSLILGIAGVIVRAGWMAWKVLQRVVRLVDALAGKPAGPGEKEAQPGLLEQVAELRSRLSQLDELQAAVEVLPAMRQHLAALDARLAIVEGQVKPNGGGSLKDQVTRIEQATTGTVDRAA